MIPLRSRRGGKGVLPILATRPFCVVRRRRRLSTGRIKFISALTEGEAAGPTGSRAPAHAPPGSRANALTGPRAQSRCCDRVTLRERSNPSGSPSDTGDRRGSALWGRRRHSRYSVADGAKSARARIAPAARLEAQSYAVGEPAPYPIGGVSCRIRSRLEIAGFRDSLCSGGQRTRSRR